MTVSKFKDTEGLLVVLDEMGSVVVSFMGTRPSSADMARRRTTRKLEDVDSESYRETFAKLQNIIRTEQERLMSSNTSSIDSSEKSLEIRHIVSSGSVLFENGEIYTRTFFFFF